ncbi:MAG: aminoglycoside phosphotransferase family protein [Alphaproteobacteria bacterium]|nr:aminoglycoside phosphotransferase family protein [Alphaproteobacteria bacterium]
MDSTPFVLRLHDRNDHTCAMETALLGKIEHLIPVPQVLKTLYIQPYWCSLLTFEQGITLSALLLNAAERKDLYDLAYQSGRLLLSLQACPYTYAGFFNEKAQLAAPFLSDDLINHGHVCLESDIVRTILPIKQQDHLSFLFKEGKTLLEITHPPSLVHGDFDPSNILVRLEKDEWRIGALLDWEYAHAGTYLQDAANWLRWRHHLPIDYMAGFCDALQEKGLLINEADWQTAAFLDVLALLDLLNRTRPHQLVRANALCTLIEERLQDL